MDPPIEGLLDKVDSKFTLVALGAARARQVNAYYNSLGEGLGRVVPPQVTSVSGKPLSIAFEEISAGKATYSRPDPDELLAEELAALEIVEGVEILEAIEEEVAVLEVIEEIVAEVAAEESAPDEGPSAS
jgi:DNA-directed RNA polymerase subunit omega